MGFVMDGAPVEVPGRRQDDRGGGGGRVGGGGFGLEAEYNSYEDDGGYGDGDEDGGHYYDDNYDHNEDGEDGYNGSEEMLSEEAVPLMPDEFYSDVDTFLSRPPPKFNGLKTQSKMRGKLEEKIVKSTSLPVLLPPRPKKIESKVNSGLKKGPGKKIEKQIDRNLLQQAFEYTAQLQHQHDGDDDEEPPLHPHHAMNKKKSSSAPHISSSSRGGMTLRTETEEEEEEEDSDEIRSCDRKQVRLKQTYGGTKSQAQSQGKSKPKKNPPNGMVKRLRSQTYTHQTGSASGSGHDQRTGGGGGGGGFDTSVSQSDGGSNRQVLDFNALVANFEQGIALKQLQQELEDSRAAMARSKRAVEEISKEMSTKMRF
jgi:hypothetical protein